MIVVEPINHHRHINTEWSAVACSLAGYGIGLLFFVQTLLWVRTFGWNQNDKRGVVMPRQARLDAPGTLHHVIMRGIEKHCIVNDDEDRENFVTRMGELSLETKTAIYAWALMSNHAHILNRSNIIAGFKQMGGKTVTQGMATARFGNPAIADGLSDRTLGYGFGNMMPTFDARTRINGTPGRRENILPGPTDIGVFVFSFSRVNATGNL
jgi:hypothetical protein